MGARVQDSEGTRGEIIASSKAWLTMRTDAGEERSVRSSSVQLIASDSSRGEIAADSSRGEEVEAAAGVGGALATAGPSCSADGDGDGDGDGGRGDGGGGSGGGGSGGGGGGGGGNSAAGSAEERYKIRRGAMLDCGDLLFKGSKKARIKRPAHWVFAQLQP